jgi:hypothetical protein
MDTSTLAKINGAARSITIWTGGLLVVLGQLAPYINEQTLTTIGFHGRSLQIALSASGLLMVACRMITTKSLAAKGGLVSVVVPPSVASQDAIIQPPPDAPTPQLAAVVSLSPHFYHTVTGESPK